jgi:hypothetical protein
MDERLLYTNLDEALARAKERSQAKAADEDYLRELLMISFGTHRRTNDIVYRPFYVAAKYLEQSRRDQTLVEADGAKFTGQKIPIKSLLDLQQALDADLFIRPSFRISSDLGELESAYEMAIEQLKQYQPRGYA